MESSRRSATRSWFRSRGGRRFGIEFATIVVLKLAALTLLWLLCVRPMPRADTAPAAVERHLLSPPPAEAAHDR